MERDDFVAPGVVARQLDGRLGGFRPRVAEKNLLRFLARSHRREPFREFHEPCIIKIRAGNMNQLGRLLLDGFDHARMAMPRRDHGNARGKIQEYIAVHVLDHRAAAGLGHERVSPRVGRRNELSVARDHYPCLGTGERRQQYGQLGFGGYRAH
jgi:hypothetical protein